MAFYILLLLALVPNTLADGHLDDLMSPCKGPFMDLEECLIGLREVVWDNERFYFGTSYADRCPPERAGEMECLSRFTYRNHSIASALFQPGTFDADLIDRYLYVNFTSPRGEYIGCDYHYKQNESISFGLDPTGDDIIPPWHTRITPMVHWDVSYDDDKQYTLIIQDVGNGFMHGVYINIPGTKMEYATVIDPYHGPLNARNIVNPYAFMLFEQSRKDINLTEEFDGMWINIIQNPFLTFNASDFRDALQMKGPIAMNWILSGFDAYSVQIQGASPWGVRNCAGLVEQAIMTTHAERPFFSDMPALSVFASVKVTVTEDIVFTYCCLNQFWAKSYNLDPIGNGSVAPAYARTGSHITISLTARTIGSDPDAFDGEYYTLLVVDPDVPHDTVGTQERPLVHWMAINGMVDDDGELVFGEDDELLSYMGPMPPNELPHTYYFLFYNQAGMIDGLDPTQYAGSCPERLAGRCLFDVDMFTGDNDLKLAGASWFVSENDDYVNMKNNVSVEEGCMGVKCPKPPTAGVSSLHHFSLLATIIILLVSMF